MKTITRTLALYSLMIVGFLGATGAFAQPNVTPYAPSGWSDKIVVTRTNGGTIDSTSLLTTDSLYVDWSVINSGTSNVNTTFQVYLYIDGAYNQDWSIPSLPKNSYDYVTAYPIGSFSAGTHTVEIVADATHAIPGDNESDNSYTKTITVSAVVLGAPTLVSPGNTTAGQSPVPAFSWSSVSNASSYRVLIATNPSDLPASPTASNGGPSVVINAVAPTNTFSPTLKLNWNTTYYWEVHARSAAEDGTWSAIQSFTVAPLQTGITIIPAFDSTITDDPQAAVIEQAINAAISVYRYNFSDAITANITFAEMTNGLGDNDSYAVNETYSAYRAALVSHATSTDDSTVLAHLPATSTNPVNGNSDVTLQNPLARALGFSASPPDGTIYLNTAIMNLSSTNTDPSKFSLFSTVCHEIDEVLGFGSALNGLTNGAPAPTGAVYPEDLFRYNGSGSHSFNTASNTTAYCSFDGTTILDQFNQYYKGDFGDWYSYYGGVVPEVQDAFLVNGANPVLGVELRVLDAIGFTRAVNTITTNYAATLSGGAVVGGNFTFNLTGVVGSNYVVQVSSNLLSWVPFSTNSVTAAGIITVTNAVGSNPRRFYRAVLP